MPSGHSNSAGRGEAETASQPRGKVPARSGQPDRFPNLIPHFIHEQFTQGIYSGRLQAVTIFVDISGFTLLTETLMQHHKDGAEVLTEVLNGFFYPLVAEVYAQGGFISTFAGDAFTALFPFASDEALLHALQSAFFIQQFFAQHGLVQTRYGSFETGVKIGLSVGAVEWGILGSGNRYTYFFRGPAIDACAQAEHQAGQGEIVADMVIWPLVQDHVQAIANETCFKLTALATTAILPRFAAPPRLSREALAPFVLDKAIDLVASGAGPGGARAEFRQVVATFISFAEIPDLYDLTAFVAALIDLADDYGGYFNKLDFGDKGGTMLVLFGAPVAYENALERAANFLLALSGKEWRAGLAYGTAYTGIVGGTERCEYTAIGDVVNFAARLMQGAGWGEIWASAAAEEALRSAYHLESLGRLTFKGKRGKLPIYQLADRRALTEPVLFIGQMVGRETELAQLEEFVQPLWEGRFAGLAYIYGEAGVGKSRLAYELHQRLGLERDLSWFTCPTVEILRQSLNPFKYFLRRYFDQSPDRPVEANKSRFNGILDALLLDLNRQGGGEDTRASRVVGDLENARPFLGALVDLRWEGSLYEQLEPKLRFQNSLSAVKSLIKAESLRRPVILELEDLHWLDTDSQELVKLLTRNVEDYPLAMIGTSRYHDGGSRVALDVDSNVPQQVVELNTLTAESIHAIAGQILGGAVTDKVAEFLAEKTEGNPFFVEQLLLDLRERGGVKQVEGGMWVLEVGEAEIPTRISVVLIARLDRLLASVRQVVQAAAVLGREFEVQILVRMLRDEASIITGELPALVKQAETERIWLALSEMRYLFRHALMRDAAYEMQLVVRRRELHRLAAEAIEQLYAQDLAPFYPDLAYHYGQAEDVGQERYYAKLAGEQAVAQFANVEAVGYFSRALELAPEADTAAGAVERYDLLLSRERLYQLQGAREAQAQDLATLAELAASLQSPQKQAVVWLRQSKYASVISDYPQAVASAAAATAAAQVAQDVRSETAGCIEWAYALQALGEYEAAHTQLTRALQLARAAGFRQEEGNALRMLGTVSWFQGDHAVAQGYYQQALSIYREMGSRLGEEKTLNDLGIVSGDRGEYDQAGAYFRESLALIREIGDRLEEASTLSNLGLVSYYLGEYAQAQVHFQASLAIKREIGDRLGEAIALANLGAARFAQREHASAEAYLQQALTICQEIGSRWMEGVTLHELGMVLGALGEYALAEECILLALALRQKLQQPHFVAEDQAGLAQLALTQGDLPQAQAYVEEIMPYLESNPALAGMRNPFRFFLNCYQVLHASGDVRATDILMQAHTLLQERAARIADEGLRRIFLNNVPDHREILGQFA